MSFPQAAQGIAECRTTISAHGQIEAHAQGVITCMGMCLYSLQVADAKQRVAAEHEAAMQQRTELEERLQQLRTERADEHTRLVASHSAALQQLQQRAAAELRDAVQAAKHEAADAAEAAAAAHAADLARTASAAAAEAARLNDQVCIGVVVPPLGRLQSLACALPQHSSALKV